MKLLHILYSGLGGHGSIFFSFVKNSENSGIKNEAIFNGIEAVKQEYLNECKKHDIPWQFVPKTPGFDLKYYRELIKAVRISDADIIFLHSSAYILPAKLGSWFGKKRKKIIIRETQANHLKTKMEWFWLAVAMLLTDRIVFLSEEYRQEISKKISWAYHSKKIAVIPNGLDLEIFKPVNKTIQDKVVIGMQSRLVRIKDHLTLLEAFSFLLNSPKVSGKTILLKIAGDGDFRQALEDKSASLHQKSSVEFTGQLVETELLDLLWSLDIYVHASLGETMSTAIMQAMACGLPVIASDVNGINNMIENDVTGILVVPKDPVAMSKAMEGLINDTNKRLAFSRQARQYAEEHFDVDRMIDSYVALFKVVLK